MRQGFDIADLEERTKIRAKYLRALENEEWGALPGHTFVKTFLRTYAEQVGLDPHMLVEEYRMAHESEERDFAPLVGPPAATRRETRRERRRATGGGRSRPARPRGAGGARRGRDRRVHLRAGPQRGRAVGRSRRGRGHRDHG